MPVLIPWHRRLEARVLAGVTAIIALSLVALMMVTSEVVSRHTIARADRDLDAAHVAFTSLVGTQSELIGTQTRLITSLPVFRAHLTDSRLARDPATLEAMADMFREELRAAFTIVSDGRGRWLAAPGLPADVPREALETVVSTTAGGHPHRSLLALKTHLYLVVAEPALFADEVLGTLTTGYAIDDAMAADLSRMTGRHVALIAGGAISGSSLEPALRHGLADMLGSAARPFATAGTVQRVRLGTQDFAAAEYPLTADGHLILLDSWAPTQAFISSIRVSLLWTGAVVFALSLGAGLVMSRRMSRPLRELADVASQIARGDGEQQLTAGGSAEAVEMAAAFNEMTTNLRHWHDEARQRTEQLQASYDRFCAITQSVHDAIVSTDADGAITFWHPRAAAVFGFSENEALGREFSWLLAPSCQNRYANAVAEIADVTAGESLALTFDGEGVRADGTAFPIELSLASWLSGGQTCFTSVIRDVTERRRAEEELRLRDQQLREAQKMDAIGRLASGIAHDFNNSLMVIQGHAEMLLMSLPESDPRRKKADVIIQASNGAATITRRLLTFGRKQTSELRLVDPREHLMSVQKVLGRLLGDNIAVVCDIEDDAGLIRIDPDQLDQVIMNLAINARDAMPDGGELRLSARRTTATSPAVARRLGLPTGEYVTIAVRDTGCGMDAATAARIFEAFFTTKEVGRGTGLGLAIVTGIITGSHGRVEVETAPGQGTTFLLHLPRIVATQEAVRTVPARPLSIEGGSETILIAEDKALVRRVLRTALEAAGYTVLEAPDGEDALALARRHPGPIDILLTDVVMPGAGGFALSEALTQERPDTRVIFMSGHPPGATQRDAVDKSGLPCLQKPFSFEELSQELRSVLAAARTAA